MNLVIVIAILIVTCSCKLPLPTKNGLSAIEASSVPELPTLYKLEKFHFAGPYSCISGYNGTALFLSQASLNINQPDILYYGHCPPSTAGFYGARGFVKDLGSEFDISNITANQAVYMTGFSGINASPPEAVFTVGHTYVKHINSAPIIGWVVLHVESIDNDGAMDITYGVLRYQVIKVTASSPGFQWGSKIQ